MDFTKGVNAEVDPRILGNGFAVVVDNADIRSFALKSYHAPVFRQEVNQDIQGIFEYRGRWWFSPKRRDWAGEFVGNQERLYYKEDGKIPMKIIDGTEAQLGTIVPVTAPKVTETDSVMPMGLTVAVTSGGGGITVVDANNTTGLTAGTVTYRVGYRTKDGLLPACAPVSVTVVNQDSTTLTWSTPTLDGIVSVVIYGRTAGQEQILDEIGPNDTSWQDSGAMSPTGQYANTLDTLDNFYYFYTFLRTVNGHLDESGPSPVFGPIETPKARLITRFPNFEGGFVGSTTWTGATVAKTATQLNLSGAYTRLGSNRTVYTTETAHGLATGARIGIITKHTGLDAHTRKQVYLIKTFNTDLASPTISALIDGDTSANGWTVGTVLHVKVTAFRGASWGNCYGAAPAETLPSADATLTAAGGKTAIVRIGYNQGDVDGFHVYLDGLWIATLKPDVLFLEFDNTAAGNAARPVPTANTTRTRAFHAPADSGLIFDTTLAAAAPAKLGTIATTVQALVTYAGHGLKKGDLLSANTAWKELSGLYTVYEEDDANHFYMDVLLEQDDSGTGKTLTIPGPAFRYVTQWALYCRRGSVGADALLVGTYPIEKVEATDAKPVSALGGTCPSSYSASTPEGSVLVEFRPPPSTATRHTLHNNCLWYIDGRTVGWSPINRPDAAPIAFTKTFPGQPVALVSYAGSMIILCTDGIWRADGFDPANLSISQTLARDGCIAPFSPRTTAAGLVYLSARGLMAFQAQLNDSVSISDGKIAPDLFTGPSSSGVDDQWPYWWIPTRRSAAWAKLTRELPSATPDQMERKIDFTLPMPGIIEEARSFYWRGKYYLFYVGGNFGYHGTVVVDCTRQGYPTNFLGMRPMAAHVTERDRAFLLLPNPVGLITTVTITSPDGGNYQSREPITYTCVPSTPGFSSGDHVCTWVFDDGTTTTGTSVTKSWETSGAHLATVTAVCTPISTSGTDSETVEIIYPGTTVVIISPVDGETDPTPPSPPPPSPPSGGTFAMTPATPTAVGSGGQVTFTADTTVSTWSVDGIVGGNSTVGTIANGVYTAPTTSAPTLRTITADSGTDTATVRILTVPSDARVNAHASYGATGNGSTNDTAAINSALAASGNGICYLPGGTNHTYMVNPSANGTYGLDIPVGATLLMDPDVILQSTTQSDSAESKVVRMAGSNSAIVGGQIVGDRDARNLSDGVGSSSMGVGFNGSGGASNQIVLGTKVSKFCCDGFYAYNGASGVLLSDVTSTYNRRQALSVVHGSNIVAQFSELAFTQGVDPGCGVDIEPSGTGQVCSGIQFIQCRVHHNAGGGIAGGSSNASVHHVTIDTCEIDHNGGENYQVGGVFFNAGASFLTLTNNKIHDNVAGSNQGGVVLSDTSDNTLTSNQIDNNAGHPIEVSSSPRTVVSNNTGTGNSLPAISADSTATLSGNSFT